MNDEIFWEGFFKTLNSKQRWLASASRLKHGADLLFKAFLDARKLSDEEQSMTQDTEIDGVATLLYGLAMENVLKAALLKVGIAKYKQDGTIEWKVPGASAHDLLSMCQSLKVIALNTEQEKLLERMSAFVHWAGKYPTPWAFKDKKSQKAFKGLLLSNQPQAARIMLPVQFRPEDKGIFEDIYKLLSKVAGA